MTQAKTRNASSASRKKHGTIARLPLISEAGQVWLARRIIDSAGLVCVALGLAIFLAMVSYSGGDNSMNTAATSRDYHNVLGPFGATIADILLQSLGWSAFALPAVLITWGIRLYRRYSLAPLWARICAILTGMILLSIALACIPGIGWLAQPYMGGAGGTLMLAGMAKALMPYTGPWILTASGVIAGMSGLSLVSYALVIRRYHWGLVCRVLWSGIITALRFVITHGRRLYYWLRHYDQLPAAEPVHAARVQKTGTVKRKAETAKQRKGTPLEDSKLAQSATETTDVISQGEAADNGGARQQPQQQQLDLDGASGEEWQLPPLSLLQKPGADSKPQEHDEAVMRHNAEQLEAVLRDFNVRGEIVAIHPGPVVTLFELQPAPGTKTSRVINLSDDIARSMAVTSVRAAVIPGRDVIGIELPNQTRKTVYLREIFASRDYQRAKAKLPLVLGKDIGGANVIADLAEMPHLLLAGTTGSGKSVAVNTMVLSLIYRLPPEQCRLIMIDPKMLELSVYADIPHLLSPVVTEPGKAVVALKWVVQEMEQRYRAMSRLGVRNIEGYNQRLRQAHEQGETLMRKVQTGFDPETGKPVYEDQPLDMTELPYIVVVVDEFADLMLVAGKEVEAAIQRLAQMARAAGIHLIMATQRPSVDVITGVVKANLPTRISFSVTSKVDSRTILGEGGAEQLLGKGDMLYTPAGTRPKRVHGPFVSDTDVDTVVEHLKAQGTPEYLADITEDGGGDFGDNEVMNAMFSGDGGGSSDVDALYDEAVAIVASEQKASTSFIQRKLQIGYNRAARIVDEMENQGVISPANHVGKREILIQQQE